MTVEHKSFATEWKAEAKVAAQKALDKGVKKPDEAKGILSR